MAMSFLWLRASTVDPVAAARLIYGGTWDGKVGIIGGIPTRSTVSQSFTSSATASQINTAIDNCAAGESVLLQAGTYSSLAGNIILDKSNVTLRGEVDANGVPTTIIKNRSIIIGSQSGWDFGASTNWTTTTVTGLTRGVTSATFASVSGLTVGRLVWLHASGNSNVTGSNWSDVFGSYPVSQVVKVTNIVSTTVTFDKAFNADYWTGTLRAAWRDAADTIALSGIENLDLQPTNSSAGYGNNYVEVYGTDECWIKNVKTYDLNDGGIHHITVYGSHRMEIRHCDISRMRTAEGSGDSSNNYCISLAHSGSFLIEDNHFHNIPNVMPMFDCGAGAFAYNYIIDCTYAGSHTWLSQIVFAHGSHIHYTLFEGNWCPGSYNEEGTSGSRNLIWLRNRMRGWDPNSVQGVAKDDDTVALVLADGHSNAVLAGNVVGENTFHTTYQTTDSVAGGGSDSFPRLSVLHVHTNANSSLSKIGNYNTVNDAVPAGEALGAGEGIVTSYLHASKPAWFSGLPWPPISPTNYSQSNTATNIPAGYRAANGVDP